jgi:chromatin segregation and condensation protein Rec8/ScpA/Scc1 (kleisin family)
LRRVTFTSIFTPPLSRGRLLGLFLAILELIKAGTVGAEQPEAFGELWLVLEPPLAG